MQERELVNISGSVENIIFSNKESGFTVLNLVHEETLLNVVGILSNVQAGEELDLTGYYTSHPTYGYQFKAETCTHTMPATSSAIKKYLSSGVVHGIGPAIAKKIVDMFGDDTLKIIEENPKRLAEIPGITKRKADRFAEEFKQVFGVRSLMLFLSGFGVTAAQTVKVWKKWGVLAMDVIRKNPYVLCSTDFQIDFTMTDKIAENFGIEQDNYDRILAGVSYALIYNLNNGHTCLPRQKVVPMAAKLLNLDVDTVDIMLDEIVAKGDLACIPRKKEFIALNDMYSAEKYIAGRINLMTLVPHSEEQNVDFVIKQIEDEKHITYETLQKDAIKKAMQSDVFILTGGPGTGKTTTLNGIIDVLEYQGKSISIAAPTGRAAKRISEVTSREAKTIHRLLEVEFCETGLRFAKNEAEPLDSDVIVIDEMSMVDIILFDSLLRAAKPAAKLILVGDYNQLPSVGAGNVLHDLLESETIPTVRLEHIFRQAAKSQIVTNAHEIVSGGIPDLTKKDSDFFFIQRSIPAGVSATILELVCTRLPKTYGFSPTGDIQVLCPQRKGELGVMELNNKLQALLNPQSSTKIQFKSLFYTFRVGDKVMQIKNNYDIEWTKDTEHGTGIFNGDIGIIKLIDRGSQTLAIDFEDRIAYYSFDMAMELELAYAITVHKSQGSEFEAVIIPIIGGYDKLYYRNLLYTAITRAKKLLIIIGQEQRVRFMIQNNIKSVRYTNLKYLLENSEKS